MLQSLFAWFILFIIVGAVCQLIKRSLLGQIIIGSVKITYHSLKLSYRILKKVYTESSKYIKKTHANPNSDNKTLKKVVNIADYRSKH